jgi:C_GCAxxG_C_C family probable redox protein
MGINMLKETAKKYYGSEYDLNCAETILYAANEEYNMNLSKQTLKSMAAFGGGMAIESVCGAITGGLAVLSIMFTKERAHEGTKVKELTTEFFEEFNSKLDTDNCKKLKEKYREEDTRCWVMIDTAVEVLDKIVRREQESSGLR